MEEYETRRGEERLSAEREREREEDEEEERSGYRVNGSNGPFAPTIPRTQASPPKWPKPPRSRAAIPAHTHPACSSAKLDHNPTRPRHTTGHTVSICTAKAVAACQHPIFRSQQKQFSQKEIILPPHQSCSQNS